MMCLGKLALCQPIAVLTQPLLQSPDEPQMRIGEAQAGGPAMPTQEVPRARTRF